YRKPPRKIWLDLDATDDPLHGQQEGRFFHGYYRCYCYLPLGEHLLCARLRTADQACLRPRDRFWDIPVPKIDSAFDNLLVPQPSWSPSTTQQLRKLVAAPYLAPNDWTPRSEAYFVFPLAQGTPGKQCGLAATGDYQPSLRSPWLAAKDASSGSVDELQRIVGQIRARWPKTRIIIRADVGFCRDAIMAWCETNDVGYVLGLARNKRLQRALGKEMEAAR
ncbi:transposase, partial [Thiolapillus sp.]|uniref:transposase n=2 Tax=Thiolapillus sp. TaxID=2017437 RepID=UPI003AF83195